MAQRLLAKLLHVIKELAMTALTLLAVGTLMVLTYNAYCVFIYS